MPIIPHLLLVDPDEDMEDAPIAPEMGTIEVRAFRRRFIHKERRQRHSTSGLHSGRVSERSKKAGWHHVRYLFPHATRPILIPIDPRHQYRRRDTRNDRSFRILR
jgi:hypothetical protein